MELETPQNITCPLCRDERVELDQNKNERPTFTCSTFRTPVNLRGSPGEREEFLTQFVEQGEDTDDTETDVEQPEQDDQADELTMQDLIENND